MTSVAMKSEVKGIEAAAGDVAAIERTLWTYLDGLYEGDVEKIAAAFHPVSHLYSEN
jgi:hypothetical protein